MMKEEVFNFRLPLLEVSSNRNREIKQFGAIKVEEVIYQHLFLDKDHRQLDKEVLGKTDGLTKGRISANILYYFGIKGKNENNKAKFRGIFQNISLQNGIEILENHLTLHYTNQDNLNKIITHLRNMLARIEGEEDTIFIDEVDELIEEKLKYEEDIKIIDEIRNPKLNNNASSTRISYKRDAQIAIESLIVSDFKCEVNNSHHTFTSRKHGQQYVEAHHLVPMKYQYKFLEASLDTHANIVALCPNCHRLIHHAIDSEYESILRKLLDARLPRLEKCGINIDIEELQSMYRR